MRGFGCFEEPDKCEILWRRFFYYLVNLQDWRKYCGKIFLENWEDGFSPEELLAK